MSLEVSNQIEILSNKLCFKDANLKDMSKKTDLSVCTPQKSEHLLAFNGILH